jgi:hypothetical protein
MIIHNILLTIEADDDWFSQDLGNETEDQSQGRDGAVVEEEVFREDEASAAGQILRNMLKLHIRMLDIEREGI